MDVRALVQQLILAALLAYSSLNGTSDVSKPIDIVFAGDTMMDGSVKRAIHRMGPDFPFQNVKLEVSKADLAIVNLETSVTNAKRKDDVQLFNFKSDAS